MIAIDIPGYGALRLSHLLLDYNGTLAVNGRLLPGVPAKLRRLAPDLTIQVLTADTFGGAAAALAGLPCRLTILPPGAQDAAKRDQVLAVGAAQCMAVGNGRNDRLMLRAAAVGVAVIQAEGAAVAALQAADLVAPTIDDALELLIEPRRLVAALRA
jgi:soluble P-type ATPase